MNKREPFRKVIVEWRDSRQGAHGWKFANSPDAVDVSPAVCVSIGFLIHEDKESVVIVPHAVLGHGFDHMQCNGEMTIPACAITSLHDLIVGPAGIEWVTFRGRGPRIKIKRKKKTRNRLRT